MQAAAATSYMAPGACVPTGRRTPRGRVRWYLVQVPAGREAAYAQRIKAAIDPAALTDAFCPTKEIWFKRQGTWRVERQPLWRGYVVAESPDAAALAKALRQSALQARLAGNDDVHAYAPVDDAARRALQQLMDADHLIRRSVGQIVEGRLTILSGPLLGFEAQVKKIDRHNRKCRVSMSGLAGASGARAQRAPEYIEQLALEVPVKS